MLNRVLVFFLIVGSALTVFRYSLEEKPEEASKLSVPSESKDWALFWIRGAISSILEEWNSPSTPGPTETGDLASLFQEGLDLYNSGDYASAIEKFDRYIEANDRNSSAFYNRGLAKYFTNDYTSAQSDFEAAYKLDSKNLDALYSVGNCRIALGDPKGGLEKLNEAIDLGLSKSYAFMGRARVLNSMEKYPQALKDAGLSIRADRENKHAYFEQAFAYYGIGKYKDSVASYGKVIDFDSEFSTAYFNRGLGYIALKKNKLACSDLKKAKDLGYDAAEEKIKEVCP